MLSFPPAFQGASHLGFRAKYVGDPSRDEKRVCGIDKPFAHSWKKGMTTAKHPGSPTIKELECRS